MSPQASLPIVEDLISREREVSIMASRGLSNEQIGAELFIRPSMAKTHAIR